VTYFKHFPHYFIRPYDAQIRYNEQEFLEKLNSKNCEWTMRPKIAISEAAQALQENWDIVKTGNYLEPSVQQQIENLVAPMQQVLTNLNTKDKSSAPSSQDIYQAMRWCFAQTDLDASLANWMQQSAAFYVFVSHLRAMRSLITSPEQYASKLVNDDPSAIEFKNKKTVSALQDMLTKMCSTTPTAAPSSRAHVRVLAQQLVDPSAQSSSSADLQPTAVLPPPTPSIQSIGLHDPDQPSTSMHTVSAAPTAEQPSTFTNSMLDIILSLQNQMQEMQRKYEREQHADTDDGDEVSLLEKAPKRKKNTQKQSMIPETSEKQLPSTSSMITTQTLYGDADNSHEVRLPEKPSKRKRNKGKEAKTKGTSKNQLPTTSSLTTAETPIPADVTETHEIEQPSAKKSRKHKKSKKEN
jgi:hypothetical protein